MKIYVNRSYLGEWGWPLLGSLLSGFSQALGIALGGAVIVPQVINFGSFWNFLLTMKLILAVSVSGAVMSFLWALARSPLDVKKLFTEDAIRVEIVNPTLPIIPAHDSGIDDSKPK